MMMDKLLLVENTPILVPAWRFLIKGAIENVEITVSESFKTMEALLATDNYGMLICGIDLGRDEKMEELVAIRRRFPQVRILVLSEKNQIDNIRWLYQNGMDGILANDSSLKKIGEAIKQVYEKGTYFDVDLLFHMLISPSGNSLEEDSDNTLAPKEITGIRLIAETKGNSGMYQLLGHCSNTTSTVKNNIFKKLGINSIEGMLYIEGMGILVQIPSARVINMTSVIEYN